MNTQRSNIGALVGGTLLIGFGLLALFGQLFRDFRFWSYLWPFAVIGCGVLFFIGMFAGGKSMAALAIPGSIITVSGLMLFFQNLTSHWATWSYGWTVTLASVGLGIFIMGAYQGDEQRKRSGLKVMKVAAVLFIVFGVFFEMILSISGLTAGRYTFPVLLILLGGYLVLSRSGLLRSHKSSDEPKSEIPS
jgi:hypothetical protein